MKRRAILVFAGVIVLCLGQTKLYTATIETFTSLQAWQAAVAGSPQFFADFAQFTRNTNFQTVAVDVGPFSLQQMGEDPTFGYFQNFIDVPPLQFTDNSGVTNAAMYTKFGLITANMNFSAPVYAWGANFYGAQSGELENLVLTASAGGVLATVPVTVDTGFFGFVISPIEGVSTITFQSQIDNPKPSVGQGFGLEKVTGAYTAQIATTASPLVYIPFIQLYIGTVTITNSSGTGIDGPFQIVLAALTSGVTLVDAAGNFAGSPFLTVPFVRSLAPGRSATALVLFRDPSKAAINYSPVIYLGSLK